MRNQLGWALWLAIPVALGCGTSVTESGSTTTSGATTGSGGAGTGGSVGSTGGAGTGGTAGGGVCGDDVAAPDLVLADTKDPEAGKFTMAQALVDLPWGPGPLRAILETDQGTVTCELFPDKAPIGVANFVGLARGRRPFKDPTTKKWVQRKFYDGLIFHRVIADFMAQGGDPLGTGYGGPGYKFANEIAGLTHGVGAFAYANSGPDTNGSQFYITETPQPGLDPDYTIFGQCDSPDVITKLTHVMTDTNDKPLVDQHLVKVTITRCAP